MDTTNTNGNVDNSAKTEDHAVTAAPSKEAAPAQETKKLRIPLALFENKTHFEKFPKTVQAKATKAGIKVAGERRWGPEISVSPREAGEIFKVAESIYRSNDRSLGEHDKTFGYQLRAAVAKAFDIQIENVRKYVRKPKAESVAAAPVLQEEIQMAASMPPRANIDRANFLLGSVLTILQENGQSGVAEMVKLAKSEIAVPDEVS